MPGFVALPTKNPGDVLTSALWNTYLQGNADSGFMRKLADASLGGSQASIDFSSIPATFAHLMLVVHGRSDVAGVGGNEIGIRLNADASAAHYAQQSLGGNGVTAAASSSLAQSFMPIGIATNTGHAAGCFGGAVAMLPNYTDASNMQFIDAAGGFADGVATSLLRKYAGTWLAGAAINEITLILGGGGNFILGTRATLYGLPA